MIDREVVAGLDLAGSVTKKFITAVVGTSVYWGLDKTGTIKAFGEIVRDRFPRFVTIKQPSDFFISKFLTLLQDGIPIGLGPHTSHVEGLVIADGTNELVNIAEEAGYGYLLPGFIIPVAASMSSGHQGPFLKGIYPHMEAYAADRKLKYMKTVRKKDEGVYGMKPDRELIKAFNNELASGLGIMALPEASVQAGRHPRWWWPFGPVNGMQEVKGEDIFNLYKDAKNHARGGHPFFVLMAYTGACHLYSPDSRLPTLEGLIGLSTKATDFMGRFGYELPLIEVSYIDVISDRELGIADLDLRHVKGEDKGKVVKYINTYLMRRLAVSLEEQYRGFYGKVSEPEEFVLTA